MLRRAFVLIGLAALLGGCPRAAVTTERTVTTLPAAPPATPVVSPTAPASSPAEPDGPAEFLAAVFGVPAAQVAVTRDQSPPTRFGPDEAEYACTVAGREYRVRTLGAGVWSVMDMTALRGGREGKTTLVAAQQVAEKLLRTRWGDQAAALTLAEHKALPSGPFMFQWRRVLAPDVFTGDDATIMVNRQGEVMSYGEHRAQRAITLEEVKITREQAAARARAILEGQATAKPKLALQEAKLILSSHLHPQRGPVWMVSYGHLSRGPDGKEGVTAVNMALVDGMTGAEVPLPGQPRP